MARGGVSYRTLESVSPTSATEATGASTSLNMIPYEFSAERFSRWMAYVLRHNPERFGLQPDRHGYVDLEAFLQVAQRRYPGQPFQQLRDLVHTSSPARFEITEARLRARYGHTISAEPVGQPVEPPPALYFGTDTAHAANVLTDGLHAVDRKILHLSATVEDALGIARRKTVQPTVLCILAQEAHRAGSLFYREGSVYLVSQIPAPFLRAEPIPASSPTPSS